MPAVLGDSQRSHCSGSGKASTGQVKPPRNASGIEENSTTCRGRLRKRKIKHAKPVAAAVAA